MAQPPWTILALIRWANDRFKKEGLATPRLDAEVLLAETLGMDRVGLYTHFEQPLQSEELARFKEFILRRLRREPVAYIVGKREFWSLSFKVTPEVLIPRPETEILVSEALRTLVQREPTPGVRILEIGTGSGAISIALAKELPSARVVATDLSAKALLLAEENAHQNGVREQIDFLQGDLFQPVPKEWIFDLIISNPPYIPQEQISSLAPEIRNFEPRLALNGGVDGLDFFRRAFPEVGGFLPSGGWFLAEIGAEQGQEILKIAESNPDLESFGLVKDLAGIQRVFKARKK